MHHPLLGTAGHAHPGEHSDIVGSARIGLVGTQQQAALLNMRTPLGAGLDLELLALTLTQT